MNRASAHADQLRRMREALAACDQNYTDEERREAARFLDAERFLPEPQQDLPLQQVA